MRVAGLVLLLAACGEGPAGPDDCMSGETLSFELVLTDIAREDAEGGVRGMNLDGRVSEGATDESSCYQEDYVDLVDGETGVDNQLGPLGPNPTPPGHTPARPTGDPIPLTIGAIDDLANDGCVTVQVGDAPEVQTELVDGRFRLLADESTLRTVPITDDPTDGPTLALPLRAVSMKGRFGEDGVLADVIVAGQLDIEETIAASLVSAPDVDPALLRTTLEGVADLDRGEDGACRALSAAFVAEAR